MTEFENYQIVIGFIEAGASILVPIMLAIFGVMFHRYRKVVEHNLEHERETFARRFMGYQEVTSLANDIYCFNALVGHFRDISPAEAIQKKRQLEAVVFSNLPLWNDKFCESLTKFLDTCFETQRGRGTQIVSASDVERHIESRKEAWDDNWRRHFLDEEQRASYLAKLNGRIFDGSYRNDLLKPAYADFLGALSVSLGGELSASAALKMLDPSK